MNIEKIKDKARKFETADQPAKAIEAYQQILKELEGKPELDSELALFNKVGDLYIKVGNVTSAVEMYERAVGRYTEQGFPNNAIALCNKILRSAPGRTHIYLKLAQLQVQRGFLAEAKQNFIEYADRMQKAGKLEEAFKALKEFADLSPDNEEVRLMLAEQLKAAARTDEAREQLAKLYAEVDSHGDPRRSRATLNKLKSIDPEYDVERAPKQKVKSKFEKTSEIVFLDLDEDVTEQAPPPFRPAAPAAKPAPPPSRPPVPQPTAAAAPAKPAPPPPPPAPPPLELTVERASTEFEPPSPDEVLPVEDLPIERASVEFKAGEELTSALEGLDIMETFEPPRGEAAAMELEPTSLAEPSGDEPDLGGDLPLLESGDDLSGAEDLPLLGVTGGDNSDLLIEHEDERGEDLLSFGGNLVEDEPAEVTNDDPLATFEGMGVEVPDLDLAGLRPSSEWTGDLPPLELDDDGPLSINGEDLDEEAAVADLPLLDAGDDLAEVDDEPAIADAGSSIDLPMLDMPDEEQDEELEEIDLETAAPAAAASVPAAPAVAPAPDIPSLERQVADDPDDPRRHQALAEALLEQGQRERGLEELEIALSSWETLENWDEANDLADEILRLEPNSIRLHQKRVEYAFRRNDKNGLLGAYLALSDAFFRTGAVDRARAVYQRILEHEPDNERALSALAALEPDGASKDTGTPAAAAAVPAGDGFVDLGSLILDEDAPVMDTRMRVQDEEPSGDEQRDFEDMLAQFKKGIEASLGDDDAQAHYDLGVAFKEMGLLDEAIAEFQKALRGPDGRLRTSEALGVCFFEKGQFSVAATVLRRAVEGDPSSDDKKIGLLYWLGRCEEEQARKPEALNYYQRVVAIDIRFQDVSQRVKSLPRAGRN